MGSYWKALFIIGLQTVAVTCYAQQIDINSLRYWNTPDQTQILFDVSSSPEHRIFLMNNPARLVIDLRNANVKQALSQPPSSHPLFSHIRVAARNTSDVRVVVDLKREISSKTMSLRTNNLNGQHLVIELLSKGSGNYAKAEEKAALKTIAKIPTIKVTEEKPAKELEKVAVKKIDVAPVESAPVRATKTAKRDKDIVIAIDAGHGGEDPGAHGQNGTEEKHITLAIAKKLADLINNQPGMKAVLVRKGDYYVDLRKRMQIARAARSDLFISIHADAFQDSTVKGASVFTLSNKGASSEAARWLANSENSSDLVGGVSLNDKEDVLASVLLDLSQTATQDASVSVARKVLKNFQNIGELHYAAVQKAGFLVLKSPDVPSILVETAFISNPSEELRLLSTDHQSRIAHAIFNGVRSHFSRDVATESKVAALAL
ncbi:MAG: N-acetylmuramoyl-L-alanine amidase [Methylobacter sp.]|nr:N-acetylmuramoyl-L-alanine amidase [Methylobacter sp.]